MKLLPKIRVFVELLFTLIIELFMSVHHWASTLLLVLEAEVHCNIITGIEEPTEKHYCV